MVHGRNRHLVDQQSADNTLYVMREVRAFPAVAGDLCRRRGNLRDRSARQRPPESHEALK
jgi:hypothetical protein